MDLIHRLPGKGGFHRLDGRRSGRGGLRFGGGRLQRFLFILALLPCGLGVYAAEPEFEFDIPRQRANGALNLYAKQANRPLLFRFDIARRFTANPVRGRFTPEAALDRLLADTGLRVVYGPQGSLSIQPEQTTGEIATMTRKRGLLSGLGTILLSTFAVAPDSGAQESGESPALEEIMVTARRVQERMQDTPISIAAFSTENLERRQIFSTDLLDQVTPNLQFSKNAVLSGNNAAAAVFIRGVGQVDPTSSVDPGVGMYIDDIYMGQAVGGAMEFRDIENVQVLRGPQGTLFGRNTVGGAILLKTRDPGEEFGGTFRMGFGSDDLRDAFLAVDAPISETLRTRFAFGTRVRDGYVTRIQTGEDLGDTDTWTATGKFIWDASEQLTVKGMFDYTHSDENGNPFVFAASTETASFQRAASSDGGCPGFGGVWNSLPAVPMLNDDRCANDFQNKGPYSNNGTYPLKSVLDNWGMSLHLTYVVSDAITLKSITAYRDLSWIGIRDADNTPLAILHTNFESDGWQVSQEFQGLYTGEKLRGVVGGYYFDDKHTDLLYVELNTPVPGIQGDSDNNIADNDNWALFTQWTYDFNEQLSFTAGGRYTEDTKGSIPDQFNYANPSAKYLPVILYEDTFTAFTFSGSVSYRWNENIMTYFNYGEGFKGGGWNSHFNVPQTLAMQAQFQAFGPEEATTYEIGFKTDLLDRTLRLNGAFFTTEYDDLQFVYRVGVAPYLANAGKAGIDGFELDATWAPTPHWIVEGGIGYLDTSVDELRPITGTAIGVAVGNVLPFSPEWQFNIGAGYIAELANGWEVTPRVDLMHQTETFFDANNTMEIAQLDDATVVNLSVAVGPTAGPWKLNAGINNANDELYQTGGNSSLTTSSGYAEVAFARPREYFVYFSYDF